MTDALEDVVDTALRRALVDGTDARRYFALAGALHRARSESGTDESPPDAVGVDRAGAALVSTVAVQALDAVRRDGIDTDAWLPGERDPHEELVVAGARLARRRFDADVTSVAASAGVDRTRLVDESRDCRR